MRRVCSATAGHGGHVHAAMRSSAQRNRSKRVSWTLRTWGHQVIRSLNHSALTGRTIVSGTLPLHDLSDRRFANPARQPRAIIDEIIELEVAALTVAADKVAQRAAAFFDRGGKRHAHGIRKEFVTYERHAAGLRSRPDARAKEAFRSVNVAHADHDLAGEQR